MLIGLLAFGLVIPIFLFLFFCFLFFGLFLLFVFFVFFVSGFLACFFFLFFFNLFGDFRSLLASACHNTTKNDTFLSINFDIILLWSGLADQLLFADINTIKGWWSANSQLI